LRENNQINEKLEIYYNMIIVEYIIYLTNIISILMATDISGDIIQNILSILNIALLYIAKLGMWIGIMITTGKASKVILYKERRWNGKAIGRGVSLIILSLILYIIVL